jgi:hypothetical protein
MATQYPHLDVIGVDISAVQRGSVVIIIAQMLIFLTSIPREIPPNCKFVQLDILSCDIGPEAILPEGSFDVIHWRFLMAGVRDFSLLLKRASQLVCVYTNRFPL